MSDYNKHDLDSVRIRLSEMEIMPWLVQASVYFMEDALDKNSVVLEFGSGASTIWFAERVKKVYSFEMNWRWHTVLNEELKKRGLENVEFYVGNPNKIGHRKEFYNIMRDDKVDLVLLDLGARDREHFEEATALIKDSGYLVVDNTNRGMRKEKSDPHYLRAFEFMKKLGWKRTDFRGHSFYEKSSSMTSIWHNE